jgi:membrane fusion protein (multidrug efflux system)
MRFLPCILALAVAALPAGALAQANPAAARALDCLIDPSLEVKLGSAVDGIIAAVLVERGDTVRRGQPLVRLNSQLETAAVDSSRGEAEFARRKAARNDELYDKQLISIQERDQLETEARLAELELREREEMLKLRTIASPIDGVVVDRLMAPGDQVSRAGSQILRLMQLDPLFVEVVAPSTLFGKIRAGAGAKVTPQGGKTYSARVAVVDRVVDAASGTFRVRLELRNPGYAIPSGLRCSVQGLGD